MHKQTNSRYQCAGTFTIDHRSERGTNGYPKATVKGLPSHRHHATAAAAARRRFRDHAVVGVHPAAEGVFVPDPQPHQAVVSHASRDLDPFPLEALLLLLQLLLLLLLPGCLVSHGLLDLLVLDSAHALTLRVLALETLTAILATLRVLAVETLTATLAALLGRRLLSHGLTHGAAR